MEEREGAGGLAASVFLFLAVHPALHPLTPGHLCSQSPWLPGLEMCIWSVRLGPGCPAPQAQAGRGESTGWRTTPFTWHSRLYWPRA